MMNFPHQAMLEYRGTVTHGTMATFSVTAMALTTAPPTRSCNWQWSTLGFPVVETLQGADGRKGRNRLEASGTISLGTANGLPVELLEFSLE